MIVLNNNTDLNTYNITACKSLVLSYNFLTIYGLPFCILYTKKLLKINLSLAIALDVNKEQGSATLAIIENYPNLIIAPTVQAELLIIKKNSNSSTQLFNSLQEFATYSAS